MPIARESIVGNFCWVEANLANPEQAKGFYGELFGWTAEDVKLPAAGDYVVLKKGNDQVGGIFELPKEMGAPPHWLSYVAVADIGAATRKAEELGARVFKAPFDAGPGKMSIIADPTGATLALWQSVAPMGTFVWRETNTLCWQELTTTNPAVATKFYVELFGWRAEVVPMGDFEYTLLHNEKEQVAGLIAQPKPMVEAKAPSLWTVYFEVEDCDKTAEKARKLGGDRVTPAMDIPNVGRFAILKDREGAPFAIITNTAQP
jgi:uncharacterized protein